MTAKKKQTLLDRLNNGMAAVDLPPGCLVQYRRTNKKNETPIVGRCAQPATITTSYKCDYYEGVLVESGTYLLYLGIVELGPRCIVSNGLKLDTAKIFAHQFYYGEQSVYLMISRPDRYYRLFRRYFSRVDDKNNLCR